MIGLCCEYGPSTVFQVDMGSNPAAFTYAYWLLQQNLLTGVMTKKYVS